MAMAARMAMIATTIISSIKVKPADWRWRDMVDSPGVLPGACTFCTGVKRHHVLSVTSLCCPARLQARGHSSRRRSGLRGLPEVCDPLTRAMGREIDLAPEKRTPCRVIQSTQGERHD